MKTFPAHGVIYLIFLIVDDEMWRYAGQAKYGHFRIEKEHQSEAYRKRNLKFLYYLWERASSVHFVLPIADPGLQSGPIFNILEQWVALIFLGLRHHDLQANLSKEALEAIGDRYMHKGAGIREPLAQWFTFSDFPMSGPSLKLSPEPLARKFWVIKQDAKLRARGPLMKDALLKGDLWTHSFQPVGGDSTTSDVRMFILKHYLEVPAQVVERLDPETIRVHCDLLPPSDEAQWHPNSVITGMWAPARYNDPARRLGIKISGKSGDHQFSWWVVKRGDSDRWVPRINTIVDVLEGLDPTEIRPRRCLGEGQDFSTYRYTRHPIDKNVGDAWATPLGFKEFEKSNYVSDVLAGRVGCGGMTVDQGSTFEEFH